MISSSTSFSDLQNHWARPFIEALAQRGIITGFPNGTFQPNKSLTRAQFAVLLGKAFATPVKRQYVPFIDVPAKYWAAAAIQKAYETQFLSGYSDKSFRPDERISRINALISIVGGLNLASTVTSDLQSILPQIYQDAAQIPAYATKLIAIATRAGLVFSYPDVKLLNPTLAATRADVAAFLYQALVFLGKAPQLTSRYVVIPPKSPIPTVTMSHQREFRGVWVATVWNGDWPSQRGLPVAQQKAELIDILDRVQALNLNALILQVRPEGDALYASQLEPWSAWLTGVQGEAPDPFYDPLTLAIAECHKRNIELHAWFNPYRAKTSIEAGSGANVSPHIAVTHPECVYPWGDQLWMDPGAKVVQDRAYNVILDVVRRYDVDGIHLDDYFYPYPIEGKSFPDDKTYAAYQANGGTLDKGDWRRENVNTLIHRLSTGIRVEKSYVKFGISPFGIYRPGQPEQIQGLDAYSELYADSQKWLESGWVDYLAPQLYWRIDQTAQSYPVLLKWWTENNSKGRHIYAGNTLAQLNETSWKLQEIDKQVEISRSLISNLSLGNIFFSMNALQKNRQGISDTFKADFYAKPALVPVMHWLKTLPASPPAGLEVRSLASLHWNANGDVRSWTLYKQEGDSWKLQQILPGATTSATVAPGTYALCAVNRTAVESGGVVVSV